MSGGEYLRWKSSFKAEQPKGDVRAANLEVDSYRNAGTTLALLLNQNLHNKLRLRTIFTWGTFILVVSWLIFIAILVSLVAGGKVTALGPEVMIALITTCSANVIGLLATILRYLSSNDDEMAKLMQKYTEGGSNGSVQQTSKL